MKVESISIEDLSQDPANARKHGERNIQSIIDSLRAFGQQKPIVVDKRGIVIAGNGTLDAAKSIGWKKIDIVRTDLEGSQATAFGIADNRTSELAEWDGEVLGSLLDSLDDELRDILAFDEKELADLIPDSPVDIVEDEVPEPPTEPVTKHGDMILLGDHRLLCGDSTNAEDVERLMDGEKINVAVTSPPYASQRKYDESSGFKPIHPDKYVEWFDGVQKQVADNLADDGSWFVNIKEHCEDGQRVLYVKDLTLAHAREWGWNFVDEYIWTHGGTPKSPLARFKNGWEPIFQFTKGKHKFRPDEVMHETDTVPDWSEEAARHGGEYHPSMRSGLVQGKKKRTTESKAKQKRKWGDNKGRKLDLKYGEKSQGKGDPAPTFVSSDGMAYPSNVLSLGKNREALGHSAAYPVSLPEFFIRAYTDKADTVFDPFMGSGTTLIAAEKTKRRGFGCEISPAYCDVIVGRWEQLTGKKAERISR